MGRDNEFYWEEDKWFVEFGQNQGGEMNDRYIQY
jgi:hypothetical protein